MSSRIQTPDNGRRDARHVFTSMTRVDALLVISLLVTAWLFYLPATPRPFDFVDFPENVRVLMENPGFANGFRSLSDVYVNHGRWAPLIVGAWAAQWTLFDMGTLGWQLTRYAVMAASIILTYIFARRLGISSVGAWMVGSFLIISPAAVSGWTRPSNAEPNALLFLLLACHVAVGRRSTTNSVLLASLLVAVMWTKEIATVAFALPLLLAFLIGDGGLLEKPRLKPEHRGLLISLGVAGVVGALPVLATLLSAASDSFAIRYGSGSMSLEDIVGASLAGLLPFSPVSERKPSDVNIVMLAYVMMLMIGLHATLKPSSLRTHRSFIMALALAIPVIGALAYAPWPFYVIVYALPFVAAGSLLLGQAATMPAGTGAARRIMVAICLPIILTFGATHAYTTAARTHALHFVVARTVARVSKFTDVDSILVDVTPSALDPQGNFGPRFALYARMLNLEWPKVRDVSCDEGEVANPRVLRLRLNLMCHPASGTKPLILAYYYRFEWPDPRPKADSVMMSFSQSAKR